VAQSGSGARGSPVVPAVRQFRRCRAALQPPGGGTPAVPQAVMIGIEQTAARTGKLMKRHNALARRLHERQNDYLRFTTDWRIPTDNNGSERDIRRIKLRQRVSGCLRTLSSAQQFCAIRSYLSTAAKHGMHFIEALVMLAEGNPWIPDGV
jgi:hypothetical protein